MRKPGAARGNCVTLPPEGCCEILGVGMSLGLCFGAALGAAMQNVAVGVALGVALGSSFGLMFSGSSAESDRKKAATDKPSPYPLDL